MHEEYGTADNDNTNSIKPSMHDDGDGDDECEVRSQPAIMPDDVNVVAL